jgi:hypothetical protein
VLTYLSAVANAATAHNNSQGDFVMCSTFRMNTIGSDEDGYHYFECERDGKIHMRRIDPEFMWACSEEVEIDGVLEIDTDE